MLPEDSLHSVFDNIDSNRFLAALLVNGHHASIVAQYMVRGLDPDSQQALQNIAQRVFDYPTGLHALQRFTESVFYDLDDRRLVCRVVEIEHPPDESVLLLLVVLTPAGVAYKQAVRQLVRHIQVLASGE